MISTLEIPHPDLEQVLTKYNIIRDCIEGEITVKDKRDEYLPVPADSHVNDERYTSYIGRANFTEYTQKTLDSLLGNVFIRKPLITLPEQMKGLELNVNGQGLTLTQLAKELMTYVMAYGRAAIQVQYNPEASGRPLSIADVNAAPLPTLSSVSPFDLLNWVGTPTVNTIVIREKYEYRISENSLEVEYDYQYRIWQLNPASGSVSMYLYREGGDELELVGQEVVPAQQQQPAMGMDTLKAMGNGSSSEAGATPNQSATPTPEDELNQMMPDQNMPILGDGIMPIESIQSVTNAAGQPITRLPIFIIGSENNDFKVDAPPLYGMASLNLAHYRNSADYEEAVYIAGQPTFYVTGVEPDWAEENLNDGQVTIGSRAIISLPGGATAGILQAPTNSLPYEAMKLKEQQMIALGASLLEEAATGGRRTATEIAISNLTKNASMASAAENTATAIKQALQMAAEHIGANPDEVNFELELSAGLMSITSQQQQSIIQFVQNNIITLEEARTIIQRDGWIEEVHNPDLVDEEAEELLLEEEGAGEVTEETEDTGGDDAPEDGGAEADQSQEGESEEETEVSVG